jgi:hypothetical protein
MRRAARDWPTVEIDGTNVLGLRAARPGVFGLLRSRVVVPRWLLAAPDECERLRYATSAST